MILDRHRAGLPIKTTHQTDMKLYASFGVQFDNFWTNTNYMSILCGVGLLPEHSLALLNYRPDIMKKCEEIFLQYQLESQKLINTLPSQYDYLKKIYAGYEVTS